MITQKELKRLLHYDSDTGIFTWKYVRIKNQRKVGDVAGGIDRYDGYIKIKIHGTSYKAHRLAWLYVYGETPNNIDHDNHVRHDNKIENLNNGTKLMNGKNQSLRYDNKSGIHGVFWSKRERKWKAQINDNNKRIHLGTFKLKSDAVLARKEAEIKHGFHINHGRLNC